MLVQPSPSHQALLPARADRLGPAALLALAAHAALVAALTLSVDWRSRTVEASAELWAEVPQAAAPPAAAPTPAPAPAAEAPPPAPAQAERDAEIALERSRREQTEQARRAEQQRREQAQREQAQREERQREERQREERAQARERQAEARRQAEEARRLAEQREANLKRLMGEAGSAGGGRPTGTGAAERDAAPSAGYAGRVVARIKPNIVFADTVAGNPAAEVEVRAAPSGSIIARRLVRSSGHADWDEAVLRAIDRTGSLPRDADGRVPSTIVITFRPQE